MIRPNPITPADADLLRQKVGAMELAPWAEDFVAITQHGIGLVALGEGEQAFTRSGYAPTVPPGFVWPRSPDEGAGSMPYTFVAQIDLKEVAPADVNQVLPPKGLLYFFFPDPEGYDGYDRAEVLFYPDTEAADTTEYDLTSDPMIMAYTQEHYRDLYNYIESPPAAYRAVGKPVLSSPLHWAMDSSDAAMPKEVRASLVDSYKWDLDPVGMPVQPMVMLGAPEEYATVLFEPWRPGETLRLLLSPGHWMNSDCPLYFMIKDSALAAGDFSEVYGVTPQH